jgi:hypothetical protein
MDDAATITQTYWAAQELGSLRGILIAVPNNDSAGENVECALQRIPTIKIFTIRL